MSDRFSRRLQWFGVLAVALFATAVFVVSPKNIIKAEPSAEADAAQRALPGPPGAYELLTPDNCVVALIDFQPQMFFGVQSHDRQTIQNNVVGLAKATKVFGVPTVVSTVETESFSGKMYKALADVFPDQAPIERTSMNSWEDEKFVAAVRETGKKKLVIAGLWTEVCVVLPAIEALRDGFEVYVVTDASGGTTMEAHQMAIDRTVQAGAIPVTWQQVMLEWQRDWARKETYAGVTGVIQEHSGAYGLGVWYVSSRGAHDSAETAPSHESNGTEQQPVKQRSK